MNKIIVAIDLQEHTEIVINKAVEVAEKFEAELHLVHVVLPTSGYIAPTVTDPLGTIDPVMYPDGLEIIEIQRKNAEESMDKIVQNMTVKPAAAKIFIGDIEDEVVNYARETGATMIVVGTHQRSGLSRLLNRETSVRILHETQIPILVVPTKIEK
ncbi:MAG: universal stress protein [Niabella sp.]